jgi:hypothetical protein
VKGKLIHIETSMDAQTWAERERRFAKKFENGQRYIPDLFPGFRIPKTIEKLVVLGYGGKGGRTHLGGAQIKLIAELLSEIIELLRKKSMHSEAVPEQYLLLRTLHFVAQHRNSLRSCLFEVGANQPLNRTRATTARAG